MKRLHLALLLLSLAATAPGCARPIRAGAIPVDSRPTPAADSGAASPAGRPGSGAEAIPSRALESLKTRVVADTLAARAAVRRCAGRKLLPDQEASHDATIRLLIQTRGALVKNDLARAESLARQARQMASSVGCP